MISRSLLHSKVGALEITRSCTRRLSSRLGSNIISQSNKLGLLRSFKNLSHSPSNSNHFRRSFSTNKNPSAPSSSASPVTGVNHDLTGHIGSVFKNCQAQGRPAFIAYTTLGFPTIESTVPSIKQLQDSGADIIELGVPFSDPLAEGPTIQGSHQTALDNGVVGLKQCFELAAEARKAGVHVPLLFMGYYNPFRQYGEKQCVEDAVKYGVNGFIIVDLPPEESDTLRGYCRSSHISFVPLIAPTTTPERMKHLISVADSFIYAVSMTGVTGVGTATDPSNGLKPFIDSIRSQTKLPVAVGFGISTPEHVNQITKFGPEGIVVGSAIIRSLAGTSKDSSKPGGRDLSSLDKFVKSLTGPRPKGINNFVPPPLIDSKSNNEPIVRTPPNVSSNFGAFGGSYVPETLSAALNQLETEYNKVKNDPQFQNEIKGFYHYIGRPSQCHIADRLTEYAGGATIWLKREDLNHTGAHKINNAVAQALLAKRLGKPRLIAETGAGQHGVASATIAAKLGMPLTVYMGEEDVQRQALNVARMELMGAKVVSVTSGTKTLKDAINEAMRDWVTNIRDTHYLIGSAIGPHPFPTIVRDFQSVIGSESRQQMLEKAGKLPDVVVACVGGGSNSIGMFYPFVNDSQVKLVGVEAGGEGVNTNAHSATLAAGTIGVLHGTRTYLLQDKVTGQIQGTHSISAGLDYPGVGPEHAFLKDSGRATYVPVNDREALLGVSLLARTEGIIPAIESAHAIWEAVEIAKKLPKSANVLVCLSGRGDKDMGIIREAFPKFGLQKLS